MMTQKFGQTRTCDQWNIAAEDQKVSAEVEEDISGTENRMAGAELLLLGNPCDPVVATQLPHPLGAIPHNDHHPLRLQALSNPERVQD